MKLSDLTSGRLYAITADEVEATIQVVTPGAMPLCVLHGTVRDFIGADTGDHMLVQLIGWAPWGEDTMSPTGLRLFAVDECPGSAWLIGVRTTGGDTEFLLLACAPTIKERPTD